MVETFQFLSGLLEIEERGLFYISLHVRCPRGTFRERDDDANELSL